METAKDLVDERPPRRMFAAVLMVEVVVLVALYFLGRYFS
jgi:hypothetical protein